MHNVLITVKLSNSPNTQENIEFDWDGSNLSLYQIIENSGKELPHGCLAGSCGACRIEVISGKELLKAPGAVEQDTLSHIIKNYRPKNGEESIENKTIRLSCRAKLKDDANGNLVVRPL